MSITETERVITEKIVTPLLTYGATSLNHLAQRKHDGHSNR